MVNTEYLMERLKEPSTWRGVVMLLTTAGMTISPELQNVIVSVGLAVVGLLGVFTKDE